MKVLLKATVAIAGLLGFFLLLSTGCVSQQSSKAIADVLVAKVVAPPMELTMSTMAFQRKNGRWPRDYAELYSFTAPESRSPLTNFQRVDFTQKNDGSLEIYAVAPGTTNRMTLRLAEESQK